MEIGDVTVIVEDRTKMNLAETQAALLVVDSTTVSTIEGLVLLLVGMVVLLHRPHKCPQCPPLDMAVPRHLCPLQASRLNLPLLLQ